MITTIIVGGSLALAIAFMLAWLLKPQLRAQIEAPKHLFQTQLRQYDRGLEDALENSGARDDEDQ